MTSFDLHVLGMPPAFILSQDQTLHLLIFFLTLARLVSLFALLIPYSELTFPVQFSKIDFLASRLLRSALVYITILSLFRQAFFLLFFEENDMVPEAGLEPARYRYRRILSYSSHSEPNGLNRNKTVFSVTFQNIKNPKKPYKISIFDAKHQKYKQFVPSSIIGSQIPNLRRWRDVGGM